jgi:hypothetical protein
MHSQRQASPRNYQARTTSGTLPTEMNNVSPPDLAKTTQLVLGIVFTSLGVVLIAVAARSSPFFSAVQPNS